MLDNLTGLRFYAAMWVFLYHFSVYVGGFDHFLVKKGYLGVDIFFVLSGFILTYAYQRSFFLEGLSVKKYYSFLVKRFAKIYPLHLLTFAIVFVLVYAGKYWFHQNDLIIRNDHIASNLLMIHAWNINDALSWNTHSWSLSDEWFAYLLLFVASAFIIGKNKMGGIAILSAIVLFFVVRWSATDHFDLNNYTYNGLERIIPEFLLGVIVGLLRFDFQISKKMASLIFVMSIIIFTALAIADYKVDVWCIFLFAGIIYALSFPNYFDGLFSSGILIYLGNISFAFYMFQLIAFYLFKPLQSKMLQFDIPQLVLIPAELVMLMLINFLMASVAFRYFEEPVRIFLVRKLLPQPKEKP